MVARRKKSKIYFGKPTQDAIIRYNESDDPVERSKIYDEYIKAPFEKMAEIIYNKFGFTYFDIPPRDVQKDVVSVMVENMHMYDQSLGRAFSYFTIVARNHLILNNNGNYKRWKQTAPMSTMPETWTPPDQFYHEQQGDEFREFKEKMLQYWERNLTAVFSKKRDIQIADAILELFRRSDYIENFNKKHLYLLIREMTDCKTHYITKVVNIMKHHQTRMLNEYLDTGDISLHLDVFWEPDED